MLFFGILSILLLTASAKKMMKDTSPTISSIPLGDTANYCYDTVQRVCATENSGNCNAKYGNINDLESRVQTYINSNIEKSFEFLLMSTYFGNYFENRNGLHGLYRKISDNSWKEAIELSKYLAQRGGMIDFTKNPHCQILTEKYELNEVESLAKALDHQKELADQALNLHDKALHSHKLNEDNDSHLSQRVNDAGLAHYLVEHFVEPLTESIRQLSGYANDLKKMLAADSNTLSVYLFDEYIKSNL